MQDNVFILPARESTDPGRKSIHNLPAQLTPLIGREQEVAASCALLRRPEVRLFTLSGTGGIGKTRLALRVATDLLDDFPDGVCLVLLAPISDPDLVIPTIAQTLGVKEAAARPLLDLLKAHLQDKHLLLVLDNFEQVIIAAPVLTELLESCSSLKLLVTSREVLRIRGEHEYPVPPLTIPEHQQQASIEGLAQYTAVTLFLQRAQAVKPDFHLNDSNASGIAAICTLLEGLPLALELAAARLKHLSVQALLARLEHRLQVLTQGPRDVHERQQTLRNTIQWSYDLLSAQEQRLFRRLSVFVGGCTLEAIEALYTRLDGETVNVFDGVTSLIDKSLVQQAEQDGGGGEDPRFVMLETIREYGLEVLTANGEAEVILQMHAAYYLALTEAAELEWEGPQEPVWFSRLEQERDNLRAAMSWLLERGEAEMALRLAAAMWWFWLENGFYHEVWYFLERALEGSEEVAVPVRAKALWAGGNLAGWMGNYEQGEMLCQESLVLYRAIRDTKGMGTAVSQLAFLALSRGDFAAARSLHEESIVLNREIGNKSLVASALIGLADVAIYQGEYARAHLLVEEGLALSRALGSKSGIANALLWLALALFSQGDLARAHAVAKECLALKRETGTRSAEATVLPLLGEIAFYQGDTTTARLLHEKCYALWREIGNEGQIAWTLSLLAKVIAAQGDLSTARAFYEGSLIRGKGVNSSLSFLDVVPALEGLAAVVAAQGEPKWAACLWGMAEAQREAYGTPLAQVYHADYEQAIAAVRTQLGEQSFAAAWAEGRTMTPEQALTAKEYMRMPTPVPNRHQPKKG